MRPKAVHIKVNKIRVIKWNPGFQPESHLMPPKSRGISIELKNSKSSMVHTEEFINHIKKSKQE